jgi:class 3 adenylate cyclase
LLSFKASLVRCDDTYEITFEEGTKDIYGKSIDLTARLLNVAQDGELILDSGVYQRMRIEGISPDPELGWLLCMEGPWSYRLKGFAQPVIAYKYRRHGRSLYWKGQSKDGPSPPQIDSL